MITNMNGTERTMHMVFSAENGAPVNMITSGTSVSTTHHTSLNFEFGLPFSSSFAVADAASVNDAESSDVARNPSVASANAIGSITFPRGSVPNSWKSPA